jgi:hypothetical protein
VLVNELTIRHIGFTICREVACNCHFRVTCLSAGGCHPPTSLPRDVRDSLTFLPFTVSGNLKIYG